MPAEPSSFLPSSEDAPSAYGSLLDRRDTTARRRHSWSAAGEARLLRLLLSGLIREGRLVVIGSDGSAQEFGDGQGKPVTVRISGPGTALRLFVNPGLEVGEAYMDGRLTVEAGDIYDLLDLCFRNLGRGAASPVHRARNAVARFGRRFQQFNPMQIARANVAHHYDLSEQLYALFLDSDLQYSCAYYLTPDDTLERAQAQKKRHIASKLLIRPGDRVLDIGSGWGGMALYLEQACGADVTGITLSEQQLRVANRRATDADARRVRFRLRDYREEADSYDRIVSVGMLEHVGVNHYGAYFRKVAELLEDDGVALIHTIGRSGKRGTTNAWIRKYIFPGGYAPALSELLPAIERAGLYVTDIEVLRLHYAETLKAWRERFLRRRHEAARLHDERFCRMWEFYLASCEATFRHWGQAVFQIQLSKRADTVPLTRDYIATWENARNGGADVGQKTN